MKASKYQIENRDYNIITCVDFNRQQQSLPPLRKLGQAQDHPFPRKAKFESAQEQAQMQQTSYSKANNSQQDIKQVQPGSMMNVPSVKFDFISFTQGKQQPFHDLKQELKILHKKKGGMGEIADLGGLCYPNFNREYQDKFKENQTIFRKQKGDYPAVTDPKFSYGPFMKPFKKFKF
ncbi:unnamed protein product (macronuclear) [Paramecium tetraurelia]|uniref:Uncharacterized protein n=2 Tax=Paramecium TaxID=5884 RepID=A0CWN9_PARTE|nr:uncharacterized protein GSPATT00001409001 [Paramecium tetraurelia]CAD8133159.1 unnamed protein product [Paramecium octaurelia]CAK75206.1 unnamed protein product [Paramecium tetraurelia]|eukprot:XP_001442603.1 hypothetical protein (macronuclear) [Paramecium tetraurelia strain d4-2]